MRNNIYIQLAALIIAILCMGTQCNDDIIDYKYNFLEKIKLFPSKKSYQIGDTIWLQYINPNKELFDNWTKQPIAADTVSVDFQVSFNRRYNGPINPINGFCDYVTATGVNVGRYLGDYGTGFSSTFGCNSTTNYEFTVGMILKEKGIYSVDLGTIPRSVYPCSSRISAFPLSTIEYRLDVADGNKDIYLAIPYNFRGESPKGSTERRIDDKQVYIVNVE